MGRAAEGVNALVVQKSPPIWTQGSEGKPAQGPAPALTARRETIGLMMDNTTFALVGEDGENRRLVFVTQDSDLIAKAETLAELSYPIGPDSLARVMHAVLSKAWADAQQGR